MRNRMILWLSLILVAVLIAAPVASAAKLRIVSSISGGKDPEEVELFAKEVSEHIGIEVEWIRPSGDDFLQTALRAGERFDLIYLNTPVMDVLVAEGALTPLTDFIKNSPILSDPDVIPPEEWEMLRYPDGEIYSVFIIRGGTMPSYGLTGLKTGLDIPSLRRLLQCPKGRGTRPRWHALTIPAA